MTKQLYRSRRNRMIGGVAGGLAEYFNIDPVIVRVAWIITVFVWGFGLIAYIILWIIVPEAKPDWMKNPIGAGENMGGNDMDSACGEGDESFFEEYHKWEDERKSGKASLFGIILIAVGGLLLIDNFFYWLDFDLLAPIVLIILGLLIIFRRPRNHKEIK